MEGVAKRVGGAKVLRMTISQRAGRWCASLTVERDDPEAERTQKCGAVGVDLGVKTLLPCRMAPLLKTRVTCEKRSVN